jgi:carbon storage regulator CsrA
MPLVLKFDPGESMMIGDDIEITYAGVSHGQVKLLIAAPRHVEVWRTKLWRAQRRAQLERETAGSGRRVSGAGA